MYQPDEIMLSPSFRRLLGSFNVSHETSLDFEVLTSGAEIVIFDRRVANHSRHRLTSLCSEYAHTNHKCSDIFLITRHQTSI
jgi:hypothetical protein